MNITEKLRFGCPFIKGTLGEKDAEAAERVMDEAAGIIDALTAENKRLLELALKYANLYKESNCEYLSEVSSHEAICRFVKQIDSEIEALEGKP